MSDPRLRDIISGVDNRENRTADIILFPSDMGVKRNGGRPGASKAPELILEYLLKLTPHPFHAEIHTEFLGGVRIFDQLTCGEGLEDDQQKLGELVEKSLTEGRIPVVLGGGHETSFGHFLGYCGAKKSTHIVNIDAHTDVRPLKDGKPHSGSPFYQALNHPSELCRSYNVAGVNPASVSVEHAEFVKSNGALVLEGETDQLAVEKILNRIDGENIMVTMDMDGVHQGFAPGVSAPNGSGLSAELWLKLALLFGLTPNVTSFDLCEVNPEYDRDHQTVRLAAQTVWNFLLGVALR